MWGRFSGAVAVVTFALGMGVNQLPAGAAGDESEPHAGDEIRVAAYHYSGRRLRRREQTELEGAVENVVREV